MAFCDYKEALKWWTMAAERGSAWAMNSIGDLYENGQGVAQSYADALAWYGKAAAAGDGLAMYNLGALYENGRGVEQSFKTAYEWYKPCSRQGHRQRHAQPGQDARGGRGFPADKAEGMPGWRWRAATTPPRRRAKRKPTVEDLQVLTSNCERGN